MDEGSVIRRVIITCLFSPELYDIEQSCQEQLNTLFETPDFQKKPYDIRALLYHDGGNGPGHYWGYIWMERANLRHEEESEQGQWFQFCDAIVTPVTEDDVFNESMAPLAVIYADRAMDSPTREDLEYHVPDTLKVYKMVCSFTFISFSKHILIGIRLERQ